MNNNDIKNKNLVLCDFIKDLTNEEYKVKPEYSTSNKNNEKVIVIQEQSGAKIVFYEALPMFNYYNVEIFANSIEEAKNTITNNFDFAKYRKLILDAGAEVMKIQSAKIAPHE